jgi:hypothetical protein
MGKNSLDNRAKKHTFHVFGIIAGYNIMYSLFKRDHTSFANEAFFRGEGYKGEVQVKKFFLTNPWKMLLFSSDSALH